MITPDFVMTVNGGREFTASDILELGTYKCFLYDSPLYNAAKETRQSSDDEFKGTFTEGFAWEVLEIVHGK